jgi:hypothetical protein
VKREWSFVEMAVEVDGKRATISMPTSATQLQGAGGGIVHGGECLVRERRVCVEVGAGPADRDAGVRSQMPS